MPLKPKPQGKVTRIWASVQLTINLGNFESLKLEAGEERTVGDLETDKKELTASLWERLETEVKSKLGEFNPVKGGPICIHYLEELE